jgi:hypothetical protein
LWWIEGGTWTRVTNLSRTITPTTPTCTVTIQWYSNVTPPPPPFARN